MTTEELADDARDDQPEVIAGRDVPGSKQRWWFLPSLVLAWFGINMISGALVGAAIPKVFDAADPQHKDTDLSVVLLLAGLAGMIVTPLFGRLSDRTVSRWGIRRPWMLGGTVIGFVGVVGMAFTDSLLPMVIFACTAQIGFGAVNMAQHSLLADQIPTKIRARISAVVGVATGLATISATAMIASLPQDRQPPWFLVPGGIGSLLCLALVFGLKDIVRTEPPKPLSVKEILGSYWLNPRVYTDFGWAWLCRFAVTLSIVMIQSYLFFFIRDWLGISQQRASAVQAEVQGFFLGGNIAMTLICGWLSDLIGRRKPIVWISCAVTAVGLLLGMFSHSTAMFMIAMLIVGAGQGAYISVDVALMTEVLPSFSEAGKDLGVVALAYTIPVLLVPIIALIVLPTGGGNNYTALYFIAVCMAIVGGLAILPIKKVR